MSSTTSSSPLRVLFTTHPDFDSLDLIGPLEMLSSARLPESRERAFTCILTSDSAKHTTITTAQNLTITPHLSLADAYATLSTYDILIVPGGGHTAVVDATAEPIGLIRAFAALQAQDGRARTIFSVCSGSVILAAAGVLKGKKAVTHEMVREELVAYKEVEVLNEERFVVNMVKEGTGEVRVITAGGVSCGLDASLWLVGDTVGRVESERVARAQMYSPRLGIVV